MFILQHKLSARDGARESDKLKLAILLGCAFEITALGVLTDGNHCLAVLGRN